MTLWLDRIGTSWTSPARTWTEADAITYALGIGAGADGSPADLRYVTENSRDTVLTTLPTFGVVLLASPKLNELGDFSMTRVVHAGQSISTLAAIAPAGAAFTTTTLTAVYDKAPHALLVLDSTLCDASAGTALATFGSTVLVRDEGGFGGDPGPSPALDEPTGPPDHEIAYATRPDQALIYRLSGDRNPLHSDPAFARDAGFERPILHGLCTWGFAARALLAAELAGDPARFGSMSGRFAAPVYPGDELTVRIWHRPDGSSSFAVLANRKRHVLRAGDFTPRTGAHAA